MKQAEKDRLARAEAAIRRATTYGQLEQLAGVTDRATWWRDYSNERDGAAALKQLIRDRFEKDTPQRKEQ